MKFALVFIFMVSPALNAETICVTEAELEKAQEFVQVSLKTAEKGVQLNFLRLYDNAVIRLDNTVIIRNLLIENNDVNSISMLDYMLVSQAQRVFRNISEMTEDSLHKRAITALKEVVLSNEKLQLSVDLDIDVNYLD